MLSHGKPDMTQGIGNRGVVVVAVKFGVLLGMQQRAQAVKKLIKQTEN